MKFIFFFATYLSFHLLNAQVGIRKTNPQQALDVNGSVYIDNKLYVKTSAKSAATDQIGLMGVMTTGTTGEVKHVGYPLFNFISYDLTNVQKDYVSEFDTKISSTNYYVLIVEAYFDQDINIGGAYHYEEIRMINKTGTWRIFADFPNTSSTNNGKWTIKCLAVHRSVIKDWGTQNYNLNGGTTGSATAAPF